MVVKYYENTGQTSRRVKRSVLSRFSHSIGSSLTENEKIRRLRLSIRFNGHKESTQSFARVKLPTGFVPIDTDSLLKSVPGLKSIDINVNMVHFYFDRITNNGVEFNLMLFEEFEVKNRRPGSVLISEYYEEFGKNFLKNFLNITNLK